MSIKEHTEVSERAVS